MYVVGCVYQLKHLGWVINGEIITRASRRQWVVSWPDPVSHGVRQKGNAKHRMPSGVNTGSVKMMTSSCLVKAELILVTSWHGDQSRITGPVWQMTSNHKGPKCGALLFELVFVWTRRRLNKQSVCLWFEHSWVVTVICMRISFQTLYPTSPMYRGSSHQKD